MSSYGFSERMSIQDGNNHAFCTEASAGIKQDSFGASAEAKYGSSIYRYKDEVGDLKFLSSGVGAKVGANAIDGLKAKVEARLDLVDLEVGGFKSKLGI